MTETPLIGLAHGSRHPATRAAVEEVMARASLLAGGVPARAAFLDLTEPDLETVCRDLVAAGHTQAVVVPLLFTNAYHARVDTPQAVKRAETATGLRLRRADILGIDPSIAEGLLHRAREAGLDGSDPISLYAVGSSSAAANEEVRELARDLALRRPGTSATASFATSAEPRGRDLAAALEPGDRLVFASLFLAPGTLLDTLHTAHPSPARARIAAPLGVLAAPAIARRYLGALSEGHNPWRHCPAGSAGSTAS
ncbi:sirohydrochlorin chelatase [Micrococcales bacterium 31B]|nr:sirohydrochlorin chelatase [Micrococcales bacterium 31B]